MLVAVCWGPAYSCSRHTLYSATTLKRLLPVLQVRKLSREVKLLTLDHSRVRMPLGLLCLDCSCYFPLPDIVHYFWWHISIFPIPSTYLWLEKIILMCMCVCAYIYVYMSAYMNTFKNKNVSQAIITWSAIWLGIRYNTPELSLLLRDHC